MSVTERNYTCDHAYAQRKIGCISCDHADTQRKKEIKSDAKDSADGSMLMKLARNI